MPPRGPRRATRGRQTRPPTRLRDESSDQQTSASQPRKRTRADQGSQPSLQVQMEAMIKEQVQAATAEMRQLVTDLAQPQQTAGTALAAGTSTTDMAPAPMVLPAGVALGPTPALDQPTLGAPSISLQAQDRQLLGAVPGASVDLADLVDQKVKEQIWDDQFVNFATLIHPASHLGQTLVAKLSEDSLVEGQPILLPSTSQKRINTYDEWLQAFFIFVAVYSTKFPNQASSLMKYGHTILQLSKSGGNWRFYDETFRRLRPVTGWSWGMFNSELWQKSLIPHSATVGPSGKQPFRSYPVNRFKNVPRSQQIPVGYCFKFNQGQDCLSNCRYSHSCWKCQGPHQAITCPKLNAFRSTNPAPFRPKHFPPRSAPVAKPVSVPSKPSGATPGS